MKSGLLLLTVDSLNYRQLLMCKASQAKVVFEADRVESLLFIQISSGRNESTVKKKDPADYNHNK